MSEISSSGRSVKPTLALEVAHALLSPLPSLGEPPKPTQASLSAMATSIITVLSFPFFFPLFSSSFSVSLEKLQLNSNLIIELGFSFFDKRERERERERERIREAGRGGGGRRGERERRRMFKSLFGGALFSTRQKGEEWSYVARIWIRTSTTLASSAEQRLLETFLPQAKRANIYIELPKYGVQTINTYVFDKGEEKKEKKKKLGGNNGEGEGEGEGAVVLTHGFGGGAGMFYKTLSFLDSEYKGKSGKSIYAIDWLGMGRSSRPTSGLMSGKGYPQRSVFSRNQAEEVSDEAIDYFVQSLEMWREAVGICKMQLIGHSLGGYLSAKYALRYPDRVEKLILLSPVGIPTLPEESKDPPDFVKRNRYFTSFISYMWQMNVTPQSVVRMFGPWGRGVVKSMVQRRFVERGLNEEECEILAEYLYHINVDKPSGEYALNALLTPVLKTEHPGVYARKPLVFSLRDLPERMPVIFLYGDRDWMFHPEVHDLVSTMKNAQMRFIDRSGHHVYFDNPEGFNSELIKFLD